MISDYAIVHFRLQIPEQTDDVYINGVWTNDQFVPKYRMEYLKADGSYQLALPLKEGYYSYQYLLVDSEGKARSLPTEGDFFQTENTYQGLVYYCGISEILKDDLGGTDAWREYDGLCGKVFQRLTSSASRIEPVPMPLPSKV